MIDRNPNITAVRCRREHRYLFYTEYFVLARSKTETLDIYDITTRTWRKNSLSVPRVGLAGTTVSGFSLFGGGISRDSLSPESAVVDIIRPCYASIDCDDQRFCTDEECIDGLCQYSDHCQGSVCTSYCDETAKSCFATTSIPCDNGIFCDGKEFCDSAGNCATIGSIPCPGTYISCDESSDSCKNAPLLIICDNRDICDGSDYCNSAGECISSGSSAAKGTKCGVGSTCNGDGQCTSNVKNNTTVLIAALVPSLLILVGILTLGAVLFLRKRRNHFFDSPLEMTSQSMLLTDIKIDYRIGGGSFGDVYKGVWNGTTPVALKMLKDASQMIEFEKETRLLQSLKHPNIVQYLGLYAAPTGQKYIVTEYLSEGNAFWLCKSTNFVTYRWIGCCCAHSKESLNSL